MTKHRESERGVYASRSILPSGKEMNERVFLTSPFSCRRTGNPKVGGGIDFPVSRTRAFTGYQFQVAGFTKISY